VVSPAAALRHHHQNKRTSGREYLERLAGEEERWLRAMVKQTARAYQVDPDDLFQDLAEGLIGTDALDMSRDGLRGWPRVRCKRRTLRQFHLRPDPRVPEEVARAAKAGNRARRPCGPSPRAGT